jgi:cysteine-rich repeat protein
MKALAAILAAAATTLFVPETASAAPVTTADEVCAPTDDPCVIASTIEADSLYPLDFGLRTVRVAPGGKLVGTVDLACGDFEVDVGVAISWLDLGTPVGSGNATIRARRSCSGDSATPCTNDNNCALLTLGTCSVGTGDIRIVGDLIGTHAPGIALLAAGSVAVQGEIVARGSTLSSNGGFVDIVADGGPIELTGPVDVTAGYDTDYGTPGIAGAIDLRADGDITVTEPVTFRGGGGYFRADAGGNLTVSDHMIGDGLPGSDAIGGTVDLDAGGDLVVLAEPTGPSLLLDVSGDSRFAGYGLYAGPGGYGYFDAAGDITISENVRLLGDSGKHKGKYVDDIAIGACWYFDAGGDLDIGSPITARGSGWVGSGCRIQMEAGDAIRVRRRAALTTNSQYAADITAVSGNDGPVLIEGKLDVRGRKRTNYGSFYGYGANAFVSGGDVTINGRIINGGGSSAGEIEVRACNLRLGSRARIDAGQSRQYDSPGTNSLLAHTVYAERGSKMRTKEDGGNSIYYVEAPTLLGKIVPPPSLVESPNLGLCPVCGNSSVEYGETCDDGNVIAGDGCSDLCQTE